jgi:hypothetical protein
MDPRLASQSFLGPESDTILAAIEVGIVGLCGGGSHLVHQLPHLRRLAKDFEASIASAKAWVCIAAVQLLIRIDPRLVHNTT